MAGDYFDGILTILTHIGALHDRGIIPAPKNTKISYCTLCMYTMVPALRLTPNYTSSALKLQIVKLTAVGFRFFLKALDGVNYAVKMYFFF